MKKRNIALIIMPLLLIAFGTVGKNYADSLINWGGRRQYLNY
jgi:hypothetical protein